MKGNVSVIERLKRKVENDFGIRIKKWDVIKHEKKSSYVARIVAGKGEKYALKSLYISPERQLFIAKSEQMLSQSGVDLAQPTPTLKGDLYLNHKDIPYVLYEWVDGKSMRLRHKEDLEAIVKVMAKFHFTSRDLDYPSDVKVYEHPNWINEYKDRLKSIERWKKEHKSSKNQAESIISREISFFRKMAKKALKALKNSRYEDYMKGLVSAKSLVHGDLHHNNLIDGKDAVTLIDFEDIRYDLPSKDLIRTYSMYTKSHPFAGEEFKSMMKTYERYNPLSPEIKQLVFIDLLFPHIFERLLRKKKYVGMSKEELKHRIKQEKKKASYIYKHYLSNKGTLEGEGLN